MNASEWTTTMAEGSIVMLLERPELAEEEERLLFGINSSKLADLLRATHDCLIARDREGRITLWNRAAEELYGWPARVARGQLPEALLQTRFPKPLPDIEAELHATGQWEGELEQTTHDGRRVLVASRWLLQPGAEGRSCAVVQLDRDLTGERHAQEELRQTREKLEQSADLQLNEQVATIEAFLESQARFRQIAEAIQDVFWLTNPSRSSIIYVNPAYEELWGRSCQSLYVDPHSWLEAVHVDDRLRLRQFFTRQFAPEAYEQSYRIVRPDGSVRWVLDRGFPVREGVGGGHRVVGIVRDITKRKELEEGILAISEREQRRLGARADERAERHVDHHVRKGRHGGVEGHQARNAVRVRVFVAGRISGRLPSIGSTGRLPTGAYREESVGSIYPMPTYNASGGCAERSTATVGPSWIRLG